MKKLAIVFAASAVALLGGSAANAADNTVKAIILRVDSPAALLKNPGDPRIEAILAPAKESARMITALYES